MARKKFATLTDQLDELEQSRSDVEQELDQVRREEAYITLQVRQAREQLRYYEELLALLRRDWGKVPALQQLVRRLG